MEKKLNFRYNYKNLS